MKSFDQRNTNTANTFYADDGTKIPNFTLMYTEDTYLYYDATTELNARILNIPYKSYGNSKFVFTVILPNDNVKLSDVESKLYELNQMKRIYKKLRHTYNIKLWLPKFKIEYESDLVTILEKLGVHDAFSDKADFSGINDEKNLNINKIKHKAFVEVNELGTEAAAATAGRLQLSLSFFFDKMKVIQQKKDGQ
ncbi:unnamed protein product [Didymodactylos carnosus]|uniref:Serpin domain-containing protein n=1 Tax=Didymodactylos carnosus TaxID=1234261 RepID=A0A815DC04_9BILA|nr:unnamed protein product [Didymodactylos carnosus]CAF4108488.1 unnamed protein product [Didymodactylos carnosus]